MNTDYFTQTQFELRCAWGLPGLTVLAPISDVVIIVDVLSFSTSVDIAASRGAQVYPYRGSYEEARLYARSLGAILAEKDREAAYSLSPQSLLQIPAGTRLVLPSPNGSTLSTSAGETPTLAGCLRNYKAVAQAAQRYGKRIAVIAAGERWADGNLRPGVEDWLGAGAVLSRFRGEPSPEARAAKASFLAAQGEIGEWLWQCGSGIELIERGYAQDVELAAALDASDCAPTLINGAFQDDTRK
jgi:2-phosphosulfolactate phosphatase